ncbi:MAG TPA: hypothetical protein VNC78_09425 [Actinomycetota bacterium]|nr:hypothetical protein [Actinomycetota bacterium]
MFCVKCGSDSSACPGNCRSDLDPPRFCEECGKKLFVVVTPTSVNAFCKTHGIPAALSLKVISLDHASEGSLT